MATWVQSADVVAAAVGGVAVDDVAAAVVVGVAAAVGAAS